LAKIAVITGASQGIGRSLAHQIAKTGYKVVAGARSMDKLESLAGEINNAGGTAFALSLDVSDSSSIDNFKKEVEKLGIPSMVINNAGIGRFGPTDEVSREDWDIQLNTNLRGAFLVTKAFLPKMKRDQEGTIVFINSVAGIQPFSHSAAYVASKFGLRGFAAALREELREYNIKVISVHPGAVNTPFWESIPGEFPTQDMLDMDVLAENIVHNIQSPGNLTVEEMIIRRVGGDF
jgi:3-oxoacyl-[acyl-carrier protein] reductase